MRNVFAWKKLASRKNLSISALYIMIQGIRVGTCS